MEPGLFPPDPLNAEPLNAEPLNAEPLGAEGATPEAVMPEGMAEADRPQAEGRPRVRQRSRRRELFCPAHPEQKIEGNGRKYFLHLLSPEELKARGMSDKKARLVIEAYPVLVLSNEWLEELFCPKCGTSGWCHVVKHDRVKHTVRWAPRELWEQVAHVDPLVSNPTVSEFTRRESRRHSRKRSDGKAFFDRG